jgi:hypothetical protein
VELRTASRRNSNHLLRTGANRSFTSRQSFLDHQGNRILLMTTRNLTEFDILAYERRGRIKSTP